MSAENSDESMDIEEPVSSIIIEKSFEEKNESLSYSTGTGTATAEKNSNIREADQEGGTPETSGTVEKPKGKSKASATKSVTKSNDKSDAAQIVISSSNSPNNSEASTGIENATPKKTNPKKKKKVKGRERPVEEFIDLVKPKRNRCLNTYCAEQCAQHISAPDFCFSYFRVKKSKSKDQKEEICMDCYNQAIIPFDKLATNLTKGEILYKVNMPIINDTMHIFDSDEENEQVDKQEYLNEENTAFFNDNIDAVLEELTTRLNMASLLENNQNYLKEKAQENQEVVQKMKIEIDTLRASFDAIQLGVYKAFAPDFQNLKGITILDDYSKSHAVQILPDDDISTLLSSNKKTYGGNPKSRTPTAGGAGSKIIGKPTTTASDLSEAAPKDLPTSMILDKPELKIDNLYYIARENAIQGSWIKARLLELFGPGDKYKDHTFTAPHYRLVELKQQKERLIDGKLLAYMQSCGSRLVVGTRVIAKFKELNNSAQKQPKSDPYYAGVVGEHPCKSNAYRYLIFFDIGYSQYIPFKGVNLVYASSPNVWDDVLDEARTFIKKYLESQDRPMVKLSLGQTVKVEYKGKWWTCIIKEIDCSLVRVHFDAINRWEWIYRGSTRLSPMYREEMAASTRYTGLRTPRKLPTSESGVVQYTRNEDFVQPAAKENSLPDPQPTRSVARKSTTRPNTINQPLPKSVPFLPSVTPNDSAPNVTGPTSKIMYFTPRDQQAIKREYQPHTCGVQCKAFLTHNFAKLKGHNPLSKPLLCGWSRMTAKDRSRKEIVYRAPCCRMIRNISEVHYYLSITESEMTVDLFDFNHMVRCLAEFNVDCTPDPKDMSNGIEQVSIPVINGVNCEAIDFDNYTIKRTPVGGVNMNLDEEFLCGCDCTDDCVDKLKCACWKMTLDGIKYLGKDVDATSVGYIYRRLQDQVITGIYECNSRCKCKSTCLNRVAQNPMSLKLQVFKTHNRGWGIRCLNDIPQGTFICCYAGTIHTESAANEIGMLHGDEYFAELDYIESVEKFKEDYEEEAIEDEDFVREKTPPPLEETARISKGSSSKKRNTYMDDNDFMPSRTVARLSNDGIRSRLRRRKDDEDRIGEEKMQEAAIKIKQEAMDKYTKASTSVEELAGNIDTVTISDDEDECREVLSFNPKTKDVEENGSKYTSVRELFGPNEKDNIYIMDAKNAGNIGRFLNHSCSPNVFVQNVFVDTHDLRFPWAAFFSSQFIRAGTELTWNYSYDIGSVPGRVLYCHCASLECKGRLL
ncbi:unnamed protein product [Ceutorhynchus assimilis]|uniref:Histone-lysine N-methyltransferase eggless n=1 Tax=Ceutorhynchus assimilis TaxID=467358 RepID=A0A9N9MTF2_9CUCU|nr:unnamed protein product [Ceutorhynchus assimilis]